MTLAHFILLLLWLPAIAICLYLLLLTSLADTPRAPARSSRRLRFDVIVPAHDEASVIARTVHSLRQLEWPREHFRIFVVADNCSDATPALARAAGAYVIERHDEQRRGKGHALQYAFRASAEASWADAVVVVDADTEVSANLLEALAARIEAGADAVQARYCVLNRDASWRTRLMTVAKTCFHVVRSRGRERLGLSCGIRGNGWCVTHCLLAEVPYAAYSVVEDVEYGIALGLAGHRVHYVDEAQVLGEMPAGEKASRSQRRRWEGGRAQLRRTQTAALLRASWNYSDAVCLDLAIDLLVPPLTSLGFYVALLSAATGAVALIAGAFAPWLAAVVLCCGALATHVLVGWHLSGLGARGVLALTQVPRFLLWKLSLGLHPERPVEWIRTQREHPTKAGS